ncbi:PREDICTED: lymphocyte antigen 6E isoform X1 [Ceratotherium simum simum]|uniref:Lymphocyte antigen 6E isoform X1 n=2 Tax=Ceratotherium simum simum TaxID=73337 RepID=A0ABM1DLW6_CERSS|nr:PREDICTED: lymphocyte antigen 6E isoform X1 [Ceratotherium simum simum]
MIRPRPPSHLRSVGRPGSVGLPRAPAGRRGRGPASPWRADPASLALRPQTGRLPSRMKVFLLVLLVALLGVEPAHSLMCFSCINQNSNWYCLKPTICSDSDNYCVTMAAAAGIGNVVDLGYSLNKGCSPICPGPPSVNLGVASVGVHCCQSFLCNISAAGGLRASATVLGLGLLLSLLSALLRLGP